jgi:hypothetical protein
MDEKILSYLTSPDEQMRYLGMSLLRGSHTDMESLRLLTENGLEHYCLPDIFSEGILTTIYDFPTI